MLLCNQDIWLYIVIEMCLMQRRRSASRVSKRRAINASFLDGAVGSIAAVGGRKGCCQWVLG